MCIRDSAYDLQANCYLEKPHDADGFGKLIEVLDRFWLRSACLLYTSDAADERSSVDLGGRRIIKKKNSRELCGERRSM